MIELIQEFFLDKGIVLEDRMEKAVCESLKEALKVPLRLIVNGEKEDVQRFKDFILNNSRIFNVRIEE